jgi:hypothetical protein
MKKLLKYIFVSVYFLSINQELLTNDSLSIEKAKYNEKENQQIKSNIVADSIPNNQASNNKIINTITKIESIEIEGKNYLWASPPQPQPAKTRVSTTFYWDKQIEFNFDKIIICDIAGTKFPKDGKLTFNKLSIWNGDVIWDCSDVPSGIYFILITHGNNAKAIKVIITK